jgi:long-chain fatty acid transport protein
MRVLALLCLAPNLVAASGFALVERDAAGLGRAYAGQAATVTPAALAFNPAALPSGSALSASVAQLWNQLDPEDAGTAATVPALYGATHGVGLGVYGAFGLATDYPSSWTGRYQALHSEINAARAVLGGAYSVVPSLRIGGSVFVQHFAADLSQAVSTRAGDRRLRVEGDDTGLGWSVGALWTPTSALALGLAYASAVDHTLKGTASTPAGDLPARVALTTPEVIRAGGRWDVGSDLALLAGATWTRWSRLQSLDIALGNGAVLSERHGWRDTWRLDLGGEYHLRSWTLRLGTAWDQSPIPDAAHRSPRLPDSDRLWLATGASYRAGAWTLSASYAHLWFARGAGEHPPLDYSASSDILALGVDYAW